MECRDVRSLADSYLSEQLLVETTHVMVQHLDGCPACRAEIEARRRLRNTLRSAFERAPDLEPRPEFLDGLTVRLRAEAPSIRQQRALRWWLSMAASVAVMVGVGGASVMWVARVGLSELAHLAAGDHQNCALKFALAEPPITLTEAARRFDPAFGALEAVQLPERSATGAPIEFVERHACIYQGQRFAHIVVRYKGTAVSLLVADAAGSRRSWGWGTTAAAHSLSPAGGFNIASFRSARHTVLVVSTLPAEDVQAVAQAVTAPIAGALAGF